MELTPLMQPAPQYVIKKTFIELVDESFDRLPRSGLSRSMSDSDLSSQTPTMEFLEWASSKSSESGSGCNTPRRQNGSLSGSLSGSEKNSEPSQKCRQTMEICYKLAAVSQQKSHYPIHLSGTEDMSDAATLQEVQLRLYKSLKDLIPVDAQGKKLTIGSILHSQEPVATHCQPCYFWSKGRCTNGEACLRCHCPDHCQQQRPTQAQREKLATRRQKLFTKVEQDYPDTSVGSQSGSAGSGPGSARNSWADSSDDGADSSASWNASLQVSGATTPVEEVHEKPSVDAVDLYQRLTSICDQRKAVPHCMVSSDQIVKHVPRDSEGNLTSIGTIPHYLAPLGKQCKPCVFWFQAICHKGESCLHCHAVHDGQKVKKIRASKATRASNKSNPHGQGCYKVSL